MKKNIDYYEEGEAPVETINMGAVEFSELIEQRINVKGRKSKQTIKEINNLIDEFNKMFGRTYSKL